MIGDPFLNYFALGLLIFVVVVIFYGIIAIHDIPARIAEKRHHPATAGPGAAVPDAGVQRPLMPGARNDHSARSVTLRP